MAFDRSKLMETCRQIEGKQGKGSVYTLDSKYDNLPIERWTTNIEDLDHIVGGGMPRGRIIEIYGPESSGKTSLAYHLCGLNEAAVYIPVEGTFDVERAKSFGNHKGQLIVYRDCKYAEDVMNKCIQFARSGVPIIVIDSVAGMVCKEDYEKAEKDTMDKPKIGNLAGLLARTLKVLEDVIEVTGTTIIFINQLRDSIGAMMFQEQTHTPGGKALKFYCSIRIQVGRRSWIEVANKDPRNSAEQEKVGLVMKLKVQKSKVCNPLGEAELPMMFKYGFVSHDDVPILRKELMAEGRKNKRKGADEEDNE